MQRFAQNLTDENRELRSALKATIGRENRLAQQIQKCEALRAENERLRAALDEVRSVVRTGIPVDREDALAAWRSLEAACRT